MFNSKSSHCCEVVVQFRLTQQKQLGVKHAEFSINSLGQKIFTPLDPWDFFPQVWPERHWTAPVQLPKKIMVFCRFLLNVQKKKRSRTKDMCYSKFSLTAIFRR